MTLKEEVAGKNANYCYAPEDKRYTAKGNVILEETDPNPENIKIRARYGKCVYDSKERFIVSQKVLFWKHSRQKEADTIRQTYHSLFMEKEDGVL